MRKHNPMVRKYRALRWAMFNADDPHWGVDARMEFFQTTPYLRKDFKRLASQFPKFKKFTSGTGIYAYTPI